MAEVIIMPRMSDTMEEGVIVEWHKKVGDTVEPGDLMAEVETDKATMELESFQEGTILYIGVEKGDAVPVEGILAIVGEEGEDYKEVLEEAKKKQEAKDSEEEEDNEKEKEEKTEEEEKPEPVKAASSPSPAKQSASPSDDNGRLKASPLAKAMAKEQGIDISHVDGTGDDGRIIKRDIENYEPSAAKSSGEEQAKVVNLPQVVGEESFGEERVSQMRKTIAKRLAQSKFSAPHFYLTIEIEMDSCIAARKAINESSPVKISFNDIIVKASAGALRKHPAVNSSWQGDTIRKNNHIHIGVAVAVDDGLVVPVIKFTDSKTLAHIATEVRVLAGKGREKKLQPDEMQGGTFSISNLGMFGIEEFTAIINPPEACILAVGGIKEVPILKDGALATKNVMKVTLSCDHRVVDGATGAQFLQTLKAMIEEPVRLLI